MYREVTTGALVSQGLYRLQKGLSGHKQPGKLICHGMPWGVFGWLLYNSIFYLLKQDGSMVLLLLKVAAVLTP